MITCAESFRVSRKNPSAATKRIAGLFTFLFIIFRAGPHHLAPFLVPFPIHVKLSRRIPRGIGVRFHREVAPPGGGNGSSVTQRREGEECPRKGGRQTDTGKLTELRCRRRELAGLVNDNTGFARRHSRLSHSGIGKTTKREDNEAGRVRGASKPSPYRSRRISNRKRSALTVLGEC